MPKKTKTQVKKAIKQMNTGLAILLKDKIDYPDSNVAFSLPKLLELNKALRRSGVKP
tara:strand:+ start:429 stop:599 length:171 start_codon:yes stop_codon:yes gene_type:complete